MSTDYVVQEGDDYFTIAGRFGFRDGAKLEAANRGPGRKASVLRPGEAVHVPDIRPRALGAAPGEGTGRNKFRLTRPTRTIKLRLVNDGGPAAGKDCDLIVGERHAKRTTAADGVLVAEVPWRERRALLVVDGQATELLIGHLCPIDAGGASAVAQRLALLGYVAGPLDGSDREKLDEAIACYAADRGLPAGSAITPQLVEALRGDAGG